MKIAKRMRKMTKKRRRRKRMTKVKGEDGGTCRCTRSVHEYTHAEG